MRNYLIQSNNPTLNDFSDKRIHWHFWDPRVLALSNEYNKPIFMAVITAYCQDSQKLINDYLEDEQLVQTINRHYTAILIDANESTAQARLLRLWYRLSHDDASMSYPLVATFSQEFFPLELHEFKNGEKSADKFARSLEDNARAVSDQPELADIGKVLYQHSIRLNQAPGSSAELTTEGLVDACERLLASIADGNPTQESINGAAHIPILECLLRLTYAFYHTPELSARCLERVVNLSYRLFGHGLKDHMRSGFFTRSSDVAMEQPVFIKKLDENAQILSLILHLYAITRQADFYDQAMALLKFILEEMSASDGAYLYSLHENCATVPGSFYRYSCAEVRQLLPGEYYSIFAQMYGLQALPDLSRCADEQSRTAADAAPVDDDNKPLVLYEHCRLDDLARYHGISLQRCQNILNRCLYVLNQNARNRRKPLVSEDKILTTANAMMISALVEAGWLLSDRIYYHYAEQLLDYLVECLWLGETVYVGRINSDSPAGYAEPSQIKRHLLAPGNLDDYVFLLKAILDCLANELRCDRLMMAERLANLIFANFYNEDNGEFLYQDRRYYSADLPLRDIADEQSPGSVPTALECFRRIAWLTGDSRFRRVSSRISEDYISLAISDPVRYASMIKNLTQELNPLIVLWFVYDESNDNLVHADRIPVFAGRTQYYRISYANLQELCQHYDYEIYNKIAELDRQQLHIVATRKNEVLEIVSDIEDISNLEEQIKRANLIRV